MKQKYHQADMIVEFEPKKKRVLVHQYEYTEPDTDTLWEIKERMKKAAWEGWKFYFMEERPMELRDFVIYY